MAVAATPPALAHAHYDERLDRIQFTEIERIEYQLEVDERIAILESSRSIDLQFRGELILPKHTRHCVRIGLQHMGLLRSDELHLTKKGREMKKYLMEFEA